MSRRDQRAKGERYLRGLLLDGKRKSMQPMAQRLEVDHQQLQQFVSSSTWDHTEVRQRLAYWAEQFLAPRAFVLDDTGFPKDGLDSPGVARMYCGALAKTGNCQVGVSLHAATDWASAALDWRLFLPASWDEHTTEDAEVAERIRRRRHRCKIDETVRYREKWRLALDMLDEATDTWRLSARPVVADIGYGGVTEFRRELGIVHSDSEYVEAGAPGRPDSHSDGRTREDAGAGRLPSFLTRTLIDGAVLPRICRLLGSTRRGTRLADGVT